MLMCVKFSDLSCNEIFIFSIKIINLYIIFIYLSLQYQTILIFCIININIILNSKKILLLPNSILTLIFLLHYKIVIFCISNLF